MIIDTNIPGLLDELARHGIAVETEFPAGIQRIYGDAALAESIAADWAAGLVPAESLAAAKAAAVEKLKQLCQEKICSGFVSFALGAPHTYESKQPWDQINLVGARLAGLDLAYTCVDADGFKSQKLHTATQIAQVFADGIAHVEASKAHFYTVLAEVMSAASPAAIDAALGAW